MDGIKPIQSILFATDLPEDSGYSFSRAASMAESCDAVITVLHVMEKLPGNCEMFMMAVRSLQTPDDLKHASAERARREIEERINRLDAQMNKDSMRAADLFTGIRVDSGKPGRRILRHLQTGQYDVLVIEIRRPLVSGKRITGRALRKILRKSPVPVFVVPIDV